MKPNQCALQAEVNDFFGWSAWIGRFYLIPDCLVPGRTVLAQWHTGRTAFVCFECQQRAKSNSADHIRLEVLHCDQSDCADPDFWSVRISCPRDSRNHFRHYCWNLTFGRVRELWLPGENLKNWCCVGHLVESGLSFLAGFPSSKSSSSRRFRLYGLSGWWWPLHQRIGAWKCSECWVGVGILQELQHVLPPALQILWHFVGSAGGRPWALQRILSRLALGTHRLWKDEELSWLDRRCRWRSGAEWPIFSKLSTTCFLDRTCFPT